MGCVSLPSRARTCGLPDSGIEKREKVTRSPCTNPRISRFQKLPTGASERASGGNLLSESNGSSRFYFAQAEERERGKVIQDPLVHAASASLTFLMASPRPMRTTMKPNALTLPFSFLTFFIFALGVVVCGSLHFFR